MDAKSLAAHHAACAFKACASKACATKACGGKACACKGHMSQQQADVEEVCMFTNSVLTAEQLIMGDPVIKHDAAANMTCMLTVLI